MRNNYFFSKESNPQIFGDNEELCLCFDRSNSIKMNDVLIKNCEINPQLLNHYSLIRGIQQIDNQIYLGTEIILTMEAKQILFLNEPGFILPQKKFKETTILELLKLVNEKISYR